MSRAEDCISVETRLEYARGYLALGLGREAGKELQAVPRAARQGEAYGLVRLDLAMALKDWRSVVRLAPSWAKRFPTREEGWVAWAFALREQEEISAARDVLCTAEKWHGATSGLLHYNLACYECLLGQLDAARARLRRAIKMDKTWRAAAREDRDLAALWPELRRDL